MLADQLRARSLASYYDPAIADPQEFAQTQPLQHTLLQTATQAPSLGTAQSANLGSATPTSALAPQRQQYNFDQNTLLGGTGAGWGDVIFGQGTDNVGQTENSPWLHFKGANGEDLAAYREFAPGEYDSSAQQPTQGKLTGYRVFKNPGDFGGTLFAGSHESKMNGIPYDVFDPTGKYQSSGVFTGWKDDSIGDALGVLSIFMMAAGGAVAAGAGAGAGAGVGAAEGAGVSVGADAFEVIAAENAAGGAFGATVAGGSGLGADAFEVIAADNAAQTGLLTSAGTSVGGDAFEKIAEENFAASRAASVPATTSGTFRPSVDSQLANVAIDQAGGNALTGYTEAAIPSVSISNSGSSWFDDMLSNKLVQTLGTKALEMGLGAVGSSLLAPGGGAPSIPSAPQVPKPLPMPDPLGSALDGKRTTVRNARARHGRQSTILTIPAGRH